MNTQIREEQFKEFAQELKENGFRVYVPKDHPSTYGCFVKDDKIGYCEISDFGGWNFGTVHKPCHECGTGYSIHRDVSNPTPKMANDCFCLAPNWASSSDIRAIKKYKDWNDYATGSISGIVKKVEL